MSIPYDLSACCCSVASDCCDTGDLARTLHCDLSSSCADYNGSFDLIYNPMDGKWYGNFPDPITGTVCDVACTAEFSFSCATVSEVLVWQLDATGNFTGCDSGTCRPTGFRRHASGSDCDGPFDITLTTGTMVVNGPTCSCCSSADTITGRVYE